MTVRKKAGDKMNKAIPALLLAIRMAAGAAAAVPAPLDRDYLIGAIAANYADVCLAAQVGIAAAVLNRMETPGFPDSAAGAVVSFRADGEFLKEVPEPGAEDAEAAARAAEAVRAAEAGADPAEGALYFEYVESGGGFDLDFDDLREDNAAKSVKEALGWCSVVIGNVGFGRTKSGGTQP